MSWFSWCRRHIRPRSYCTEGTRSQYQQLEKNLTIPGMGEKGQHNKNRYFSRKTRPFLPPRIKVVVLDGWRVAYLQSDNSWQQREGVPFPFDIKSFSAKLTDLQYFVWVCSNDYKECWERGEKDRSSLQRICPKQPGSPRGQWS